MINKIRSQSLAACNKLSVVGREFKRITSYCCPSMHLKGQAMKGNTLFWRFVLLTTLDHIKVVQDSNQAELRISKESLLLLSVKYLFIVLPLALGQ